MNNRGHLPAGQPMQGGVDMGAGGVGGGPPPGPGAGPGGPRRGGGRHSQQHFAPQHAYPQHANQFMYPPGYIQPYGAPPPAPYYMSSPYQNGAVQSPGYMGYPPAAYNRSPPTMQPYAPLVAHGSYVRPPQHSPAVSSPYQAPPPPPAAVPIPIPPPHTPSSTHSSFVAPPMVPPPPVMTEPPVVSSSVVVASVPVENRMPTPEPSQPEFEPQDQQSPTPDPVPAPATLAPPPSPPRVRISPICRLPWYSHPNEPFPSRTTKSRRHRKRLLASVEGLPGQAGATDYEENTDAHQEEHNTSTNESKSDTPSQMGESVSAMTPKAASTADTTIDTQPAGSSTPSTQEQPSEYAISSSPTTPSSVQPPKTASSITLAPKATKPATRSALPPLPVVPALPKTSAKEPKPSSVPDKAQFDAVKDVAPVSQEAPEDTQKTVPQVNGDGSAADAPEVPEPVATPAPAPAPVKPSSWAALFTKAATSTPATNAAQAGENTQVNGAAAAAIASAAPGVGIPLSKASAVAEALEAYRVGSPKKLAFLEPRGLVNTGNMCYMNSVLQVLIFCVPFYDFLDQVGKKAAYSFKSETPLLDAMIMFMREYPVIDSAVSVDQLRRRLKNEELEQYGEAFTPDFVYEAIKSLPRFASMQRGHQQDAEEFLGFLLEGLHDECAKVMQTALPSATNSSLPSPTPSLKNGAVDGDDWLEVGPRQRAAITRSSGHASNPSPVTKIFGGKLRSELRVPGLKNSVTLEPYQPLQLDIGSQEVRNIVDALKGLTRPETLHGDFNSPHGKDAKATKQVFIEELPPVLILHLKRFQFDAEGHGTVKIWKKIGYPLELEIPREVFSRQKRNTMVGENAPRYRLIAVVYHHGKNASGGHYTVDVRRQDGREWIRLDDTVIRRLRSEDVAEGGSEEDAPKAGAAAAEARKENGAPASGANRFGAMNDEDAGDEDGWKQAPAAGKKWSSVVNGRSSSPANGAKAKQTKDSIKDNKVAYLLFYERM